MDKDKNEETRRHLSWRERLSGEPEIQNRAQAPEQQTSPETEKDTDEDKPDARYQDAFEKLQKTPEGNSSSKQAVSEDTETEADRNVARLVNIGVSEGPLEAIREANKVTNADGTSNPYTLDRVHDDLVDTQKAELLKKGFLKDV